MKKISTEEGGVYYNETGWELLSQYIQNLKPSKIFIITDENTRRYCLPYFLQRINTLHSSETLVFPAGEEHKNIDTCLKIWNELSQKGADRGSVIINLGGGVVTDLGGFVASTFKRGIPFINIPTSLLSIVDASVGGKNGIDLGNLKNQIGVIKNAELVLIDTKFLKTLPKNELISGYAEMLKHGLIYGEDYWSRIKNIDFSDSAEFDSLIRDSIEIKENIVAKDPHEKNLRKTLNYGHTLGHAIESYCLENPSRKNLLHGEAIAIGMILATYISSEMANFPKEKLTEVTTILTQHFPKQSFDKKDIEAIIKLLVFDKKNRNGKVLFVLLEDFGTPKIDVVVNKELIFKAFDYYKNF